MSFTDLFSIFLVGLFQYWVFAALAQSNASPPLDLHFRMSFLLAFAGFIHFRTFVRIYLGHDLAERDKPKRRKELKLQAANIAFASSGAAICWYDYTAHPGSHAIYSVAAALLVGLNIAVSLRAANQT